jgi:hypothetical protein
LKGLPTAKALREIAKVMPCSAKAYNALFTTNAAAGQKAPAHNAKKINDTAKSVFGPWLEKAAKAVTPDVVESIARHPEAVPSPEVQALLESVYPGSEQVAALQALAKCAFDMILDLPIERKPEAQKELEWARDFLASGKAFQIKPS